MIAATRLAAVAIRKTYPGVTALNGVSIGFEAGEVHALIGKNGAGKSTLVRILSGSTAPTEGVVQVDGASVKLRSPRDAMQHGIATVYQELSLVPEMTVGQNICLPNLPKKWGGLRVDWSGAHRRARQVLDELRIDMDVHVPVGRLGVARMQMVEIAKAMAVSPKALLLDEPTSALAEHEAERLFELVRLLTFKGVAVVYISHRMREIQAIGSRVSVLRDGGLVGTIPIAEASAKTVAHMMFGDVPHQLQPPSAPPKGEVPLLELRNLRRAATLQGVDLKLERGEILGIAGVVGSGRTELLRAVSGADRLDSGSILVNGVEATRPNVRRMNRLGVGLAPENRKREGLVLHLSVRENVCLANLASFSRAGVLQRRRQRQVVADRIRELQIAVHDAEQAVGTLSGGNQQKVVLAKLLNIDLRVLLLDEPTRGVDIQAKQQVFQIMWQLSRRGIGTLFVSSELEELTAACHRIAVMQQGRIVGCFNAADVTPQQLFRACTEFEPGGGTDGKNSLVDNE